jgi:hypothetical protein
MLEERNLRQILLELGMVFEEEEEEARKQL